MRKTVSQKVKAFMEKEKSPTKLYIEGMNKIYQAGSIFNVINTAFYYGYMCVKGGARA